LHPFPTRRSSDLDQTALDVTAEADSAVRNCNARPHTRPGLQLTAGTDHSTFANHAVLEVRTRPNARTLRDHAALHRGASLDLHAVEHDRRLHASTTGDLRTTADHRTAVHQRTAGHRSRLVDQCLAVTSL